MPKITLNTGGGGPGRQAGNLNTQTLLRIQRVSRMEISGVRDQKICDIEGISHAQLSYLRSLPEYLSTRTDLLEGHLTELDRVMAGKVEALRAQFRQGIPAAMRAILDVVNQRRDLRSALAAAGEILDRDPDSMFLKKKDPNVVSEANESVRLSDTFVETVSKESEEVMKTVNQKKVF